MQSKVLRARRAFWAALCLSGLLLTVPLARSAYAADKDDAPRAAVAAPHYYYVYPAPHWGWRRWGWGWGPGYWDPYWSYYYVPPDTTGKVKLHDSIKSDQVYLNGAFAGESHDLKTMKLDPGTYRIEVRRDGHDILNSNVYVATGKTVKIDVDKAA